MKRIAFFLITLTHGFSQAPPRVTTPSLEAEEIIPRVTDFSFNERWINPALCGRRFWCAANANGPTADQTMDIRRLAWTANSEEQVILATQTNPEIPAKFPWLRARLDLVAKGEVPVTHVVMRSKPHWDESTRQILWGKMPTKEELAAVEAKLGTRFLGWSVISEWGNSFQQMVKLANTGDASGFDAVTREMITPIVKGVIREPVKTRKDFARAAADYWRASAAPFDNQLEAHDGTYFWAIQWPALLGARSIIAENRYIGRSSTQFQAFTRAAGRMGQIPWGYAPGCEGDAMVPPYRSAVPSSLDQTNRGWFTTYSPNRLRRLLYYMCMGDAAIIRDELQHRTYVDQNDGNFRLNWYGHLWDEVMEFSDQHPDHGTPYTPIGVLLAWENGFSSASGHGLKSFATFAYNDGEHMTRELFNRVLYPTDERGTDAMDLLGASPFGDIHDPLRIDTPRGPLPLELLKNYKVLIAAGEQNLDRDVVARLREYVTQGGVLILNVKQLDGDPFGSDFLGVDHSAPNQSASTMKCMLDDRDLLSAAYTFTPLRLREHATALYRAGDEVVVARHPFGKGQVITVGAHWMLADQRAEPRAGDVRAQMLPLAGDLMERLVKAVLPFQIRGEHVAERALYQVNRKGNGWVLSLYNNSGRETAGGKGPEIVRPDHRVDLDIVLPADITDAVEWIGHERLSTPAHTLHLGLEPGEVRIVELQPQTIPPLSVKQRVNYALNRPVKSSASAKAHGPELAVNGNRDIYDAWWSAEHCDVKTQQWLEVDLGETKRIRSINSRFMWSEDNDYLQRIYQYFVETSTDGQTWTRTFDESKNMSPAHPRGHHRYFDPVDARYVRITTTLNTAHGGAQLVEFEVYGDDTATHVLDWKQTSQR